LQIFWKCQDVEYKPRAYRKAARTVESLSKPIEETYEKKNKLTELSGVGESIAEKIAEIIETGTSQYLEINAFPERIDLDDFHARAAKESGCKLAINTDAHNKEHLKYMQLGIAVARRGWLRKDDVVNTVNLKDLMKRVKS
jgi:histidinol phosphatase-like PHP family hydrolase